MMHYATDGNTVFGEDSILFSTKHPVPSDDDSEDEDDKQRKIKLDLQLKRVLDDVSNDTLFQASSVYNIPIPNHETRKEFFGGKENRRIPQRRTKFSFKQNFGIGRSDPATLFNGCGFSENITTIGALPTPTYIHLEHNRSNDDDSEDEDDKRRKLQLNRHLEEAFDELEEVELLNEISNCSTQTSCFENREDSSRGNENNRIDKSFSDNLPTIGALPTPTYLHLECNKSINDEDSEDEDDKRRKIKLDKQLEEAFDDLNEEEFNENNNRSAQNSYFEERKDFSVEKNYKSNSEEGDICNGRSDPLVLENNNFCSRNIPTIGALPTPTYMQLERNKCNNDDSDDEDDKRRMMKLDEKLEDAFDDIDEDDFNEKSRAILQDPNVSSNQDINMRMGTLNWKNDGYNTTFQCSPKSNLKLHGPIDDEYSDHQRKLDVSEDTFDDVENHVPQPRNFGHSNHNSFHENWQQISSTEGNNITSCEIQNYGQHIQAQCKELEVPVWRRDCDLSDTIPSNEMFHGCPSSNFAAAEESLQGLHFKYPQMSNYKENTIEDHSQFKSGVTSGFIPSNIIPNGKSYDHLKQLYEVRGRELDEMADKITSLSSELTNVRDEREMLSVTNKQLQLFLNEKEIRIKSLQNELKEKNEGIKKTLEDNEGVKYKLETAEDTISSLKLQVSKLRSSDILKTSQKEQELFFKKLRTSHTEEIEFLNKKLIDAEKRFVDAEFQTKTLDGRLQEMKTINNAQLEKQIKQIKELTTKLKAAEQQIHLLVSAPRISPSKDREDELILENNSLKEKLNVTEKELKCYDMMLKNGVFKSLMPNDDSSDYLGLMKNLNFDDSNLANPELSIMRSSSVGIDTVKSDLIRFIAKNKEFSDEIERLREDNSCKQKQIQILQSALKSIKTEDASACSVDASKSILVKNNVHFREQNSKLLVNYSLLQETAEKLLHSMNEICNKIKTSSTNLESVPYASLFEGSNKLAMSIGSFNLLHHQASEQLRMENIKLKEHFLAFHENSLQDIKGKVQEEYESIIDSLKKEIDRISVNLNDAQNHYSAVVKEKDLLKDEILGIRGNLGKFECQSELFFNENMHLKKKLEEMTVKLAELHMIQHELKSQVIDQVKTVDSSIKGKCSVEDVQILKDKINVLQNQNEQLKLEYKKEKTCSEKDLKHHKAELLDLRNQLSEFHKMLDIKDLNSPENAETQKLHNPVDLNELQVEVNTISNQIERYKSWSEKFKDQNLQLKSYEQQIRSKDQQITNVTSLYMSNIELLKENQKLHETEKNYLLEKVDELSAKVKLLEEAKGGLLVNYKKELKIVSDKLKNQEILAKEIQSQCEQKLSNLNKVARDSETHKESLLEEIKNLNKDLSHQLKQRDTKYEKLKVKFFKLQKNKSSLDECMDYYKKELKICKGNEDELLMSVKTWLAQVKNILSEEMSLIIKEILTLQKRSLPVLKASDLEYSLAHLNWLREKLSKLEIYEK